MVEKNDNDDDENDDDKMRMDLDAFRISLAELASSSLDVKSPKYRNAKIQTVKDELSSSSAARRVLSEEWKDLKCSSLHASRRIVPLFTASLLSEEEDAVVRAQLCRGLAWHCRDAGDSVLLNAQVEELQKKKELNLPFGNVISKDFDHLLVVTAVALGWSLVDKTDEGTNDNNDWLQILLQHSTTNFSDASELALAQNFLSAGVAAKEWNEIVLPTLKLKLKSHPDKALSTIQGWIENVAADAVTGIDNEWISLLIKHLTSAKQENRATASNILLAWAQKSTDAARIIAVAVATATAALAPARISVYETLERLAVSLASMDDADTLMVIEKVLMGLLTFLQKEPKAEQRASGLQAVVEWLVLAKRAREAKGYEKAIAELIQKPVQSKKAVDAAAVLGILVERVHPDLLESIALDIWMPKDKAWETGLEAMLNSAATKKSVQAEGLLVVYFALLYADQASKPVPGFVMKLIAAGSSKKTDSFLYAPSMMDLISSNEIVSTVLPRTIALYTQLASKNTSESLPSLFPKGKISVAARALAVCVTCPSTSLTSVQNNRKDMYASNAIVGSLEKILTYHPTAAEELVQALQDQVNEASSNFESMVKDSNASRQAREADDNAISNIKGQGSVNAAHCGFDANSVRRVARVLSKHCRQPIPLAKVLVLMHAGSSLKNDGHQRAALILNTLHIIRDIVSSSKDDSAPSAQRMAMATEIVRIAANLDDSGNIETDGQATASEVSAGCVVSRSLHKAALSLLMSLGGIACNFSPSTDDAEDEELRPYVFASRLCIQDIASMLSSRLKSTLQRVENLSAEDIELYHTPVGSLFRSEEKSSNAIAKTSGKRLSEEEEWELQMKKELAEKRTSSGALAALSEEDKKLIAQQDIMREQISILLLVDLIRALDSIRCLCCSDIEVGNECLPLVSESVLAAAVSICPAIKRVRNLEEKTFQVLTTLGTCVYEIHEVHAPTMAAALKISCRKEIKNAIDGPITRLDESKGRIQVSALPSPCAPAACVVYEMDHYQDTVSGASFSFLFPVIQASLMGPRTPPGCEASLRVLERHTKLLAGKSFDPVVAGLRRDMATCVLELLNHDRAQTFHDPTPFEALSACYQTDVSVSTGGRALSTSELAPLLDERGALGSKACRQGAMLALSRIAEDHRKLIKSNPLIENRIWLNCFDKDEDIRSSARQAWATVHDISSDLVRENSLDMPGPSPMYAAPLLPLLSHPDSSIAQSAADAFAHAMGRHPQSVAHNIEVLCKTYIDSFPTAVDSMVSSVQSLPESKATAASNLAAPPRKKISTGLPKKKVTTKKSALAVAGIGKPKSTKKKSSHSALLKPKQERTLDQDALENQFKVSSSKTDEGKDSPAKIAARLGVLRAITALTDSSVNMEMDETTLKLLTSFLMAYGIADCEDDVKGAARNALRDIVASNGGSTEAIAFLLPHLEEVLKTGVADESSLGSLSKVKVPKDVAASDRRKEGAVVALGSVALHLKGPENEGRVENTVDMLISALTTPSEEVQQSVADALTKLMKKGRIQDRIETILSNMLNNCLHGESLAIRRGAAYGLGAAVKGSGIATLKKYEIVKQLEEACASGGPSSKEGALFAIELLGSRLGLLFEPYVIVLLPSLLKSFSDSSDHVRKAANDTAGLIMSRLSAHGVKLVLPAVLTAFDDSAWRTKTASINMLGAMSHLAPKQLAVSLPKIVPQLTEAYTDSTHAKVKASAEDALNQISTVIKNPEISSISAHLLAALKDPAHCTTKALEVLIQTEFLHAIDAPSLALIVPILHRGLRDRGATTKRYSGLIAGNICTMINDPKDFVPYLPMLLPDLQLCLLDPIPDVRSTSAKALGSLTRSLGDHILLELRPWLIQKLRQEACSSAERSGAAQGLTEVLLASGTTMVEDTMRSEILPLRSYPEASTREGVLWMLTFLPPAMGQGFTPLIDVSLPALISGLSDDSEPVREVALRAGRVLIRSHGKIHVDKILPSLEAGLSDEDHRIRVASLALLGDLLSMIGGTQVLKGEGDTQDDIRKAERAQAQIALVLGSETRKRVLSGLYLARSDTVHMVRQSAVQVWKTVVSVTARALREILPVLVAKIIDDLASGSEEKTDVAGRCLGDLVSKLGDSVLPQIIPVLRNALRDGDEHTRRGVCVGLCEVIKCSTKEQILRFIEIIVKVVQDALSDDDEGVRKVAASSFQSLHGVVGSRALDEIVPSLMIALESGEDDEIARTRALNGLTGILSVRSRELLPYIVPRLIKRPMTINHAEVLSGVARVTGGTIYFHFASIIPVLLGELADLEEGDEREAIKNCSHVICESVDSTGVNWLISEVASKSGSDKAALRRESCRMFEYIIIGRAERQDFYEQIPVIIRELLYRLNDNDVSVLKANHAAFSAISKHVPAEELVKHVEFMRNLLASMVSDARRRKGGVGDGEFLLPGFNMPKGLEPLLPIYQRGILYGSPAIREVSAAGLGEVIELTASKYLSGPLIVKMTGPLLRIVGDRNPANVKIAILKTLGLILVKGGPALRAFVPQFQTTFVKALSDPSRQVRIEAIYALSLLMPLSTRVDPLIKELVAGSLGKNTNTEGLALASVQTATLEALAAVLDKGGSKAKLPTSVPSALDASKALLASPDEGIREAAARVMGVSCSLLGTDVTCEILLEDILHSAATDSDFRHGKACAIHRILASKAGSDVKPALVDDLQKLALEFLNDDKSAVREAGCVALCATIGRSSNPKSSLRSCEGDLLKIMNSSRESIDMHRAVAKGLCTALLMIDKDARVDFVGLTLMDACLQMALKSAQRVQLAFNDVLWLALDVENGRQGLDRYCELAVFDNQRAMKSLHSKVLTRTKELTVLGDN